MSPIYSLYEDTQLVIRAIEASHTACKDEIRQNLRSHRGSVFIFLIKKYIYNRSFSSESIRRLCRLGRSVRFAEMDFPGQIASF